MREDHPVRFFKGPLFWGIAAVTVLAAAVICLVVFTQKAPDPDVRYSITRFLEDGTTTDAPESPAQELGETVIMDAMKHSTLFQGEPLAKLPEYYRVRQYFRQSDETHDYFAYRTKAGTPALKRSTDGWDTKLPEELYSKLEALF